jgi:hypothetical protein
MIELKEGDVYRWRYTDEIIARRRGHVTSGTIYWCEDQQAIVRNGTLYDTYWAGHRLSPCGDQHAKNLADVELEFVCNWNDIEYIEPHAVKNYDAADVFDLSYQHGCYKYFAIKKGAKPSTAAKLEWLYKKRAEIMREIESHIRHLELLAKQQARLEAGDTEIHIG